MSLQLSSPDETYMEDALMLAGGVLGTTAPNPSVGCVIVKNDVVIGRGATAKGGRPHAETQALAQAGANAKDATAYVTLEPCSHHGKTPPCAQALIDAGIARVFVACMDPNPEVNGKGIQMLKGAGIEVMFGIYEADAQKINKGFFRRLRIGMPEVNVKIATTPEGSFTHPTDRWITGERARWFVHKMRAHHDAILTGIGTVLADDPELTSRIPEYPDRSPKPFVLDTHLRFPETAKLARPGTVVLTTLKTLDAQQGKIARLKEKGVEVIGLQAEEKAPVYAALQAIAKMGMNRVMVEAGPILTKACLESGHTDKLYWFKPLIVGDNTLTPPPSERAMKRVDMLAFHPDVLLIYEMA